MTAFTGTPTGSTEYNKQVSGARATADKVGSKLMISQFHYTHLAAAGAGTGTINLVVLPPGKITIYPDLSRLVTSQFASAATISLGTRLYTNESGTDVAESAASLTSAAAAGSGALDQAFVLPAIGFVDYDTQYGLTIFATIASGNIETDDTIDGFVAYSRP